jgi:CNT family concentrative nucleoside transporter
MESSISFLGLFVLMFLAWLMSSHRGIIHWRIVIFGLLLQWVLAYLTLRTVWGRAFFEMFGAGFNNLLGCVDAGSRFVFGDEYARYFFAFRILPTIIFFASIMSLLYYLGVMQAVIRVLSDIMQKTLGTSGAETLSTSANIFVGQTEAPLVVKPYIGTMTQSELMCVMVGGFASTAGGVLALGVSMGLDAGHLMTASVISAPATILIAKLMQPEIENPVTLGIKAEQPKSPADNAIHAVTMGAGEGVALALNVAACIIAFLALIALVNGVLGWLGSQTGAWMARQLRGEILATFGLSVGESIQTLLASAFSKTGGSFITLEQILGWMFAPLAWLMGLSWSDSIRVGELLGIRMAANEVVAYAKLSEWMTRPGDPIISQRAMVLATYALSGFANFSSIGIQVGGIGPMAPHRQKDLARLGMRAMLGGTLATLMTGCVAGMFLNETDLAQHQQHMQEWKALQKPGS